MGKVSSLCMHVGTAVCQAVLEATHIAVLSYSCLKGQAVSKKFKL